MLRSLVGSEMCIRDSKCCRFTNRARLANRGQLHQKPHAQCLGLHSEASRWREQTGHQLRQLSVPYARICGGALLPSSQFRSRDFLGHQSHAQKGRYRSALPMGARPPLRSHVSSHSIRTMYHGKDGPSEQGADEANEQMETTPFDDCRATEVWQSLPTHGQSACHASCRSPVPKRLDKLSKN